MLMLKFLFNVAMDQAFDASNSYESFECILTIFFSNLKNF